MARPCTICTGKKRAAIDEALAAGTPTLAIAANTGVPETTVRRHGDRCVPKMVRLASAAAGIEDLITGAGIAGEVIGLYGQVGEILGEARKARDLPTALAGIGKALDCLSLLGKLTGKLGPDATVNVVQAVKVTLRLPAAGGVQGEAPDGF